MADEFRLTEEQISFIKKKLKIESLEDLQIIIECNSELTKRMTQKLLSADSKRFFVMQLCPPDYIEYKPICP